MSKLLVVFGGTCDMLQDSKAKSNVTQYPNDWMPMIPSVACAVAYFWGVSTRLWRAYGQVARGAWASKTRISETKGAGKGVMVQLLWKKPSRSCFDCLMKSKDQVDWPDTFWNRLSTISISLGSTDRFCAFRFARLQRPRPRLRLRLRLRLSRPKPSHLPWSKL